MSASVAMPNGPATFPGAIEFCIKKTFVYVVDDFASLPKRCNSLPPSVRLAGIQHGSQQFRKLPSQPFSEIDSSTEASGDDTTSEVDTSSVGDTASVSGNDVVYQTSEPTRLKVSARAWHPRAPGSTPSETRLVSTSKPWSPGALPPLGPGTRLLAYQFQQVLTMVKTILATCLWIDSVVIDEIGDGFRIAITVPVEHIHHSDEVDKLAKAALLQAVESSGSINMLGSQARPFVITPRGFMASLAAVPDEHTACWGMLRSGFCHYGNRCHWQHPCDQRTVYVELMLPEC